MIHPVENLIHGYLDETLDAEQQVTLGQWIKDSPENAKHFAKAVLLHDRLRSEMLALEVAELHESAFPQAGRPSFLWKGRYVALTAAACLIFLAIIVGLQFSGSTVFAASAELQRIIQASESSLARTYVVTALDGNAETRTPSTRSRGEKPSVDGALLSVAGEGQYVLIRYFADGTEFITGSNGATAWSVPPRGRVRVSRDPTRFRGAVPGQQHAIPFIDMRNSLQQLQESYELDLSSETTPEGWRRMNATRKVTATGGPKQVTICYDGQSGTIHKMLLERLPQARGGPKNVLLELTEERDLGQGYFEHASHHDTTREVIEE